MKLLEALKDTPVIAILRALQPTQSLSVASTLLEAGINVLEVPLNTPHSFDCLEILSRNKIDGLCLGAGTVTCQAQIDSLAELGIEYILTPHCDPDIIRYALSKGILPIPGVATATEAFAAYQAGARWLKLFPAHTYGVEHLISLKAVLPNDAKFIAVGGVGRTNTELWLSSGAIGVGIGKDLYKKGDEAKDVSKKVTELLSMVT